MRAFCSLTPGDREAAHMVLDDIAENLGYLATHVATCRAYADISDISGLSYSLNAGKAYFRSILDLSNDLRRITGAAASIAPRTPHVEQSARVAPKPAARKPKGPPDI